MQADPAVPESTGHPFSPNASLHGWTFDVEGVTGFSVAVRIPVRPKPTSSCCRNGSSQRRPVEEQEWRPCVPACSMRWHWQEGGLGA